MTIIYFIADVWLFYSTWVSRPCLLHATTQWPFCKLIWSYSNLHRDKHDSSVKIFLLLWTFSCSLYCFVLQNSSSCYDQLRIKAWRKILVSVLFIVLNNAVLWWGTFLFYFFLQHDSKYFFSYLFLLFVMRIEKLLISCSLVRSLF